MGPGQDDVEKHTGARRVRALHRKFAARHLGYLCVRCNFRTKTFRKNTALIFFQKTRHKARWIQICIQHAFKSASIRKKVCGVVDEELLISFFQHARERLPEHSAEILGSDTRLCGDTGLSFIQVTSWFINARKRGWKPLIYQNTDHAELISAATLRGPLEAGLEVEPGTCSQSGALACSGHNTISNSDIQVTIFHEVEHSQSKAEMQ